MECVMDVGIVNMVLIWGMVVDFKFLVGKVDLIFCVDVYYEFSYLEYMFAVMCKFFVFDGVLVLVEFCGEDF